jgi:hypothetical protein
MTPRRMKILSKRAIFLLLMSKNIRIQELHVDLQTLRKQLVTALEKLGQNSKCQQQLESAPRQVPTSHQSRGVSSRASDDLICK